MGDINPTVIVSAFLALVLFLCALKYTTLSAQLSALGAKLTLKGRRSASPSVAPPSGGIRKNLLFGKVNIKTKGLARIDQNLAAGDVTMRAEELKAPDQARSNPKRNE